ncbi:hypothetical protein XAP412_270003 [Xanthomonas phaseoli pv. phaseoli]|uniref:Uncharacterized protein n=1 Tax=Xanthomonas campestris pv. phaseoli TaxID=317013 RepID=A0AB38E0L7_XANCH|nr:hypothetical protein XAP6984_330003 [Xanthomonas phaseoli pv. phaseoli]SON82792.1 hypothetical protein XAP412_270003 [Xanthomonas phaseoli pv. phaseoli]SON87077.1 hypothetical protein XAP7430_280003 [Xanthomonas phaseoli pv. phaseoli]
MHCPPWPSVGSACRPINCRATATCRVCKARPLAPPSAWWSRPATSRTASCTCPAARAATRSRRSGAQGTTIGCMADPHRFCPLPPVTRCTCVHSNSGRQRCCAASSAAGRRRQRHRRFKPLSPRKRVWGEGTPIAHHECLDLFARAWGLARTLIRPSGTFSRMSGTLFRQEKEAAHACLVRLRAPHLRVAWLHPDTGAQTPSNMAPSIPSP